MSPSQIAGAILVAFCVQQVDSLKIVGHAIGGSEVFEREKFNISSKSDPKQGVTGDVSKTTDKQLAILFQIKPIRAGDEDARSDTVEALKKALGGAVAEFIPVD
ncbi:uncharacterized protein LOC115323860 isoform X3 [Ixodes scapularis]|uniref:uncharacterized protein LOC115323860 isoform X3 n=1 Tax=Ixodes scapularis TaxID=6945 RepID=UPI001A9EE7C3|nr:uncharacterized protein LOC115323860 isoform X3 [Ixodes scapularis]